jgi:hypothetical protein
VEFVALCGCSDTNVSKLYRLCAAHSYVRYTAKVVAIQMCLNCIDCALHLAMLDILLGLKRYKCV